VLGTRLAAKAGGALARGELTSKRRA